VLARCLSALNSRYADLDEVEQLVLQDPGTSAHLLQVANSALLSSGGQIRSVGRAMMQIGFERTKLHILGLSVRGSFSAPSLQRLWNHSIRIAELARDVAAISQAAPPDEASLIGIVHDIGRLALAGLGRDFENGRAKLQAAGFSRLDAERELCGSNHARIGAELLASWLFPSDMVEAIRGHHAPSRSQSPLAALLFIAESWAGDNQEGHYEQGDNEQGDEDAWDRIEHSFALRRLNLKARDLKPLGTNHHPDLQLLRFAAAA
jgi:putative nucleotidyltransferase with HDIG domain